MRNERAEIGMRKAESKAASIEQRTEVRWQRSEVRGQRAAAPLSVLPVAGNIPPRAPGIPVENH